MDEAQPGISATADHIQTDVHALAKDVAGLHTRLDEITSGWLNPIYGQLSELRAAVDELLPAARRAAAMLDTPVTSFLAARKTAEAVNGIDQRAGTPERGRRGSRAARRKLPDA